MAKSLNDYALSLLQSLKEHGCEVIAYPNMIYEFGELQISQIMSKYHLLFTMSDVKSFVEIWRNHHAHAVLQIMQEVFHDMSIEDNQTVEDDTEVEEFWEEIANDSSIQWSFNVDSVGEEIGMALDSIDASGSHNNSISTAIKSLLKSFDTYVRRRKF